MRSQRMHPVILDWPCDGIEAFEEAQVLTQHAHYLRILALGLEDICQVF